MFRRLLPLCAAAAAGGVALYASTLPASSSVHLPSGWPMACCAAEAPAELLESTGVSNAPRRAASAPPASRSDGDGDDGDEASVVRALEAAVGGRQWVLTGADAEPYTIGARLGRGRACAVVMPGTLQEAVAALQACVDARVAVLPQGRNTGLTGGSVPRDDANRPFVIISTVRLNRVVPLAGGAALLALGGAGIADAAACAASVGRESHSVLGSFFLNPTVGAGVALGSGGTQLRKGPVYTERVLYARVDGDNRVRVVDTLGLALPPGVPSAVDLLSGAFQAPDLALDARVERATHDTEYAERLCTLDSSVARCNADTHGPEAVRSEGKVLVLASVHSTFSKPQRSETLWLSCTDFEAAHRIRARCLRDAHTLPSQLEYMDADSYAVIDQSGRALCHAIRQFGIGERLRHMWNAKLWIEARPGCERLVDRLLHAINPVLPAVLPPLVAQLGTQHAHHLIVTLDSYDGDDAAALAALAALKADVLRLAAGAHVCTDAEAALVKTFRFAAAPAFRTYCIGTGAAAGLSFDYSLPKNYTHVPHVQRHGSEIVRRMRYSHFGCAVVHEDIAYKRIVDADTDAEKCHVKAAIEQLGGRLPAEHGHGIEYAAPAAVVQRWQRADPTNTFNPGVGHTSTRPHYGHERPQL